MPNSLSQSDRHRLIDEIARALSFDRGLFKAAQQALADIGDKEVESLCDESVALRLQIEEKGSLLQAKKLEMFSLLEGTIEQQVHAGIQGISLLLADLKVEGSDTFRLIDLLRKEYATLKKFVLKDKSGLGLYITTADAIASTARKAMVKRIDLDEKVRLGELSIEAWVGLNEVFVAHEAKPFEGTLFNCLQACMLVDSLDGFGMRIDKFSTLAIDELRRIGPQLQTYARSPVFEQRLQEAGDDITEVTDLLLNCADVLKFWAGVADETSSDAAFETCFELYERALRFVEITKHRAPLIISRYADACLRQARLKFETAGVTHSQQILWLCKRGTALTSRITAKDGDLRPEGVNLIPLKIRELKFAMLAMEVDPSIEGLKPYAVSTIFELAAHGDRLRGAGPWFLFTRIFSELYDDTDEGIAILEAFLDKPQPPAASRRAFATLRYLKGWNDRDQNLPEGPAWLAGLRFAPGSIARFKEAVKGYNDEGYGPKGSYPSFEIDSGFPNFKYARLFRHLVRYDELQSQSLHDTKVGTALADSDLLSYFHDLFGFEQAAALEELSKFLLNRGKLRLFDGDVQACIALLELGISYSDDAYWYGRLVAAYRHIRELDTAKEFAALATAKFPNDSPVAVQAALVEAALGDYPKAAAIISDFASEVGAELSSCHESVQGIYAYSMLRSDQGRIAEGIYRSLVASRPGDWRARHGLGCLLYRQGPEYYLEALRQWTSTVLIRDKADDLIQDWISRDCVLNIAQTAKELRQHGPKGSEELSTYLNEVGESLPSTKLANILEAFTVCGGLQDQILHLTEHVSARRNSRLYKAFVQSCMSMLVEDVIKSRDPDYFESIIKFALQHAVLGDLFGGAKGSYERNLMRIAATPMIERKFDLRWSQLRNTVLPGEWDRVADLAASDGYTPNYYGNLYENIAFAYRREASEIEKMLGQVIYRVADTMRARVDRRKIILADSYPRSFAVNREDFIGDGLDRKTYNCDPDKLRAVLQHFEPLDLNSADEYTSWKLGGRLDDEMQHALMTSNIRTEAAGAGAFTVSVGSWMTFLPD